MIVFPKKMNYTHWCVSRARRNGYCTLLVEFFLWFLLAFRADTKQLENKIVSTNFVYISI